jgi:hypothetical protein
MNHLRERTEGNLKKKIFFFFLAERLEVIKQKT